MELNIDHQLCDLLDEVLIIHGFDLRSTYDLGACRTVDPFTVRIPNTARNRQILGFGEDPHALGKFNLKKHEASISHRGIRLFEGSILLKNASTEAYILELRNPTARWAHRLATTKLNALKIDFRETLSPQTIVAGWSNPSPIKFFPIHRDSYPQQSHSQDLFPVEQSLSVDDYHPFLHVATLVRAMFHEAGYTIESRFMESAFFQQLYISGDYGQRNAPNLARRMGFRASRTDDVEAEADFSGRVYADPSLPHHSIQNIVETATEGSLDADQKPIRGLYNNGNCFDKDAFGNICYTPLVASTAQFEYHLRYTTDHRILNRNNLRGFDRLFLNAQTEVCIPLPNRYVDRRPKLDLHHTYTCIVFEHQAPNRYQLRYRTANQLVVWATFDSRTVRVTTPPDRAPQTPELWEESPTGWVISSLDWALYDGHIEEQGSTTVEIRVRTPSIDLPASKPFLFNRTYFAGAEPRMKLRLDRSSTLSILFSTSVGCGSELTFPDVCQYPVRQSELFVSLVHLFNLRFRTLESQKRILIEPYDQFYRPDQVIDWRQRTDLSHPVWLSDRALHLHKRRTWSYQPPSGVVARWNTLHGTQFGAWHFDLDSHAALQGEEPLLNPLFEPSQNAQGDFFNAPAASILQIGDRDMEDEGREQTRLRIVRYMGLQPLPEGQFWQEPCPRGVYPLVAFHLEGVNPTDRYTLCFEDRDQALGLNRFYRQQLDEENVSDQIELHLHVAPREYAALFHAQDGIGAVRSLFHLHVSGGEVLAFLRKIIAYDAEKQLLHALFLRTNHD